MRCYRGGQEPSVPAAHCKHIKILITHYETKNNAQNIRETVNLYPGLMPSFFSYLTEKVKVVPYAMRSQRSRADPRESVVKVVSK